MSATAWKSVAVVQLVTICALVVFLFESKRPKADVSKVEKVLGDIRGAMSVGANYTQFQERVQSLAAAIEGYKSDGGAGADLKRFEESLGLYKDSLDLWGEMITYPELFESGGFVPGTLRRIAGEQGFDISDKSFSNRVKGDVLLQQLWAKADEIGRGKKAEGVKGRSGSEAAMPDRHP
jgi:hypothetical protein